MMKNSSWWWIKKRTFDTEMKCHRYTQVTVQTSLDFFKKNNTPVSMASSPFAARLALTETLAPYTIMPIW